MENCSSDDEELLAEAAPCSLGSALTMHGLAAHRDDLVAVLHDSAALHRALKAAGVAPIGRRMQLISTLRRAYAATPSQSEDLDSTVSLESTVSMDEDASPLDPPDTADRQEASAVATDEEEHRMEEEVVETAATGGIAAGATPPRDDESCCCCSDDDPAGGGRADDVAIADVDVTDVDVADVDVTRAEGIHGAAEAAEMFEGAASLDATASSDAAAASDATALREALKAEGNGHVARGEWRRAIASYRAALATATITPNTAPSMSRDASIALNTAPSSAAAPIATPADECRIAQSHAPPEERAALAALWWAPPARARTRDGRDGR